MAGPPGNGLSGLRNKDRSSGVRCAEARRVDWKRPCGYVRTDDAALRAA